MTLSEYTLVNPTLHNEKWGLHGYALFSLSLVKCIHWGYLSKCLDGAVQASTHNLFGSEIRKYHNLTFEGHSFSMKDAIILHRNVYVMYV